MENRKCTLKEFKEDITDLCETCPIRNRIAHELKKYDSFIKVQKEILPPKDFSEYLKKEREDLRKKMEQAIKSNDSPTRVPEGITEVYVGNREIIKLLTTFEKNNAGKDLKNQKTIRYQALKLVYEGKMLPAGSERTKLENLYNYYHTKLNRTGYEETKLKMKNKITLFENVIKSIPKNKRGKANDELKILKNLFADSTI